MHFSNHFHLKVMIYDDSIGLSLVSSSQSTVKIWEEFYYWLTGWLITIQRRVYSMNGKSYIHTNAIFFHCLAHITVFENHRKSLIQHCERSEIRLHFEWTKVKKKCSKMVHFGELLKNRVTRHALFERTKIVGNFDLLSDF